MSGGEGRLPSDQDIQLVKNCIEWCIQNYMNKKEAINILNSQRNIEPRFTETVWERLERENQEFFNAYYVKLVVKDQILEFNRLLTEQVERMRQSGIIGINQHVTSSGSHMLSTQHMSIPSAAQNTRLLRTEDMQQSNVFHNYGTSIQSCAEGTFDQTIQSREISPNMFLSRNPDMGLAQKMSGQLVRAEAGYAGRPPFNFSAPSNFLESHPLMGDASMSLFRSFESNEQLVRAKAGHSGRSACNFSVPNNFPEPRPLMGDASTSVFTSGESNLSNFLFDWDACPVEQDQQHIGPELSADFTISPDLVGSYNRQPFLGTDANNFVNPHGSGELQRLDPSVPETGGGVRMDDDVLVQMSCSSSALANCHQSSSSTYLCL
ncbi:hypothetical protein Sango_0505900 [Sesamum angolense]|uniref:Uncharacterized protein n=1 Tax=Sesamum angolense TaxID=2727404 RepID=A0AAE2C4Y7_9LAMI|nr:hypothetical protein Sango_0505900 [Sesamum angolense]